MSPLEQKIKELEQQVETLKRCLDPTFTEAIKQFASTEGAQADINSSGATGLTAIAGGSTPTVSVTKAPVGSIDIIIDGTSYRVPYYN
jgi:hypothetical protein